MTYQKLMEYIEGRTVRKPKPGWACGKKKCKNDYGFPLDEYYHCVAYIERKIREDYVRRKKGSKIINRISVDNEATGGVILKDDGRLIGTVRTKNNNYNDKECNGCRFESADLNDFEIFMSICRTHDEINDLFNMWCPKLKGWMCEAFEIPDVVISATDNTYFKDYDWLKNDKDFWKMRLCQ